MLTFGRRFTFWALRHITDRFQIAQGPLAFPLFLTLSVAALTNAFGLHPLLGAFVVGLLLRGAPRVQPPLIQSVQTMTFSFFGPIFFVLAGMCVNVLNLGVVAALGTLLLLFIVATGVKVLAGLLGARLGGLRRGEALLVGIGLNVKGGSDVVVALVGTEIGLLSSMVYTLYAVVAILTVLLSSPLLNIVDRKVTPSVQEIERHEREAIQQAAAVRWIEHVLVPTGPPLVTSLTTDGVAPNR